MKRFERLRELARMIEEERDKLVESIAKEIVEKEGVKEDTDYYVTERIIYDNDLFSEMSAILEYQLPSSSYDVLEEDVHGKIVEIVGKED